MSPEKLPSCFHIGVQKAASTLLYNLLGSHPDVSLSSQTEVHFYHKYFDKGFDWYQSLFAKQGMRIDTSPKYFVNGAVVAPRIKEHVGTDAPRFLLVLKNPVDVINSHFLMNKTRGQYERHPEMYPVVPTNVLECIEHYPVYVEQVQYHQLLTEVWFKHFSREQFYILILERFSKDQDRYLREIQEFFGLPVQKLSVQTISQNKLLKNPFWYRLRGLVAKQPALKTWLKQSRSANWIFERVATTASGDMITTAERQELAGRVQTDVEQLRELLNDPLTEWSDFAPKSNP